jgi:hypothetical protein
MRNEINTIIYSKNRGCQLEALLRNLNMPAVVIYTYDTAFKTGYEKVQRLYPSIKFLFQTDFKQQTIDNLGEYVMFESDDDVMINHFNEDCWEFEEFKRNPEILCLSLRLSFKYPLYRFNPYFPDASKPVWPWKDRSNAWGYPMAATSTIYRKEDILPILEESTIDMRNPSDLELELTKKTPNRPLMICGDNAKFINILANQVHGTYFYPTLEIPLEDMEERFLSGERISLEPIKEAAKVATRAFLKIPFEWEKEPK